MAGAPRKNVACVVKTFRFDPQVVEDMERVMFFTRDGKELKYKSMTSFVMSAMDELIKKERRMIEQDGVVWEHLKPGFKNSLTKKEIGNG